MRRFEAFIDTNVLIELYALSDLVKAYDAGNERTIRERLDRARGSYWMAMALARKQVGTISFGDETSNVLNKLVEPKTPLGGWTAMAVYVLDHGGVFDGWVRGSTQAGDALALPSGPDKSMVELAKLNNLVLITRDARLIARAGSNVVALTPEQYAAQICSLDEAREMFFARWPVAVGLYLPRWTSTPSERDAAIEALRRATGFLGEVWKTDR